VRRGDETFIQYWLYYPDSNSVLPGTRRLWAMSPGVRLGSRIVTGKRGYPGYHPDDWESYQVRIAPDGSARVRASSHHDYQGCKQRRCRNTWTGWTGWTRVSKGSHAGHIPLRREPVGPRRWAPRGRQRHQGYRYVPLVPGRDLHERTSTSAGLRLIPLERVDTRAYRALDPGIRPPWLKEVYRDPLSNSTS
jgi:hypothetical protein